MAGSDGGRNDIEAPDARKSRAGQPAAKKSAAGTEADKPAGEAEESISIEQSRAEPAGSGKAARLNLGFGIERLGFVALTAPLLCAVLMLVATIAGVLGYQRLSVDDSLSELFRTDTEEFRRFEAVSERFPSNEYDVLVVVEGKDLLARKNFDALRNVVYEMDLSDGVAGIVSLFSARGEMDAKGYAPPLVPDDLPEGKAYEEAIAKLRKNEIVKGKFLSPDGQLALIVIALKRADVVELGADQIINGLRQAAEEELKGTGLRVQLTGAPVMQMEIRNAVKHDQLLYNGLGLLFGAGIAMIFFRRFSLMIVAALPPLLATLWSLGLLGWLGFKLNLFLNVMTPLIMVLGFADSMQMTSALRMQIRHGEDRFGAARFAILVVGPACVLAHGAVLLSFLALQLSDSGLIRTFGQAGALSTVISFICVIIALPLLATLLIRNENGLAAVTSPADGAMDALSKGVGWIVDVVVKRPATYTAIGFLLFAVFGWAYSQLEPRYRLADQVPDREQALAATGQIDEKLTGANPVHVMIEWKDGRPLYSEAVMGVVAEAHKILEETAGLGNVWSLQSLRRWLKDQGDDSLPTVKKYVGYLPKHLVQRFVATDEKSVLVTGRLPDIDSSEILPVVDKIDAALEPLRLKHPEFTIAVTGLPAIAARNSSVMISQLNSKLPLEVIFVSILIGLAFRSLFVGFISLLPGLFPIVTTGALLWLGGDGLEFASVVALIVVFGLGVDSLIHFLNRLRMEERAGEDPALAIRRARILVGPALILTTIVLAFGLGVTILSDLPSLRLFGKVSGLTLMAALFADLVFLPATIVLWRRWRMGGKGGARGEPVSSGGGAA